MSNIPLISAAEIGGITQSPASRMVGAWHLDVEGSDLGADHPANDYRLTRTIGWNGTTLTETDEAANIVIVGYFVPKARTVTELRPDGVEREVTAASAVPMFPTVTMMAKAGWQGDNLYIHAYGHSPFGYWTRTRRLFLSPDGTVLTEFLREDIRLLEDSEKVLVFRRVQ